MLSQVNNKWIVTFDTIKEKMHLEDKPSDCMHMFRLNLANCCTKDIVQ